MTNDHHPQGRKDTVLSRFRAVLGPGHAPSGLGMLFLVSMVHELARADRGELSAQQLAELSTRLDGQRDEWLALVEVIRSSYPEISDQLFGEQAVEVTEGHGEPIDLQVLAEEIAALEESGYLDSEEILRLRKALEALQAGDGEGDGEGDDIVVAQAGPADMADQPAAKAGASEGGAVGTEEAAVDIEALPPTGAGPLVALGPVLAGAAVIVGANIVESPGAGLLAADTTAPAYVGTSTSIAAQTITLTYSEALSTTGQPLAGSFQVQTRATVNDPWTTATISGVQVSGSTVVISLDTSLGNPLVAGRLLQITYTDPTTGNDANAIQDVAGNDATTVVISTGIVADGYVRGAQIYIDSNGNGVADADERLEGVVTDANGNFFLPDSANGPILAVGGVDIDTGVPNTMVMKAPAGSVMISPLTTLVQTYLEQNGGTVANANAAVVSALGLTLPPGQTLATYDPLAALAANSSDVHALNVQKAAAEVATVVQAAAANPAAGISATTVASNVIANLVNQIEAANTGSTTVDLTNTATLASVYGTAGTTVTASTVSTATTDIANALDLGGISQAQASLLDTITPAAPTAVSLTPASDSGTQGDDVTNATTPSVRVMLNVTATDGTAAVTGNTVSVFVGSSGTAAAQATLSATNIANGCVDIAVSGLPANATSNLTAKISDAASHTSAASAVFALTIDTHAPAAPAFALVADTGVSASDGITNNGAVHVTGLETGATWQYSTDGGSNWTTGTGSDFTLPGSALYLAGTVQVRQIDTAGNTGTAAVSSGNITVGLGTPLTIASGGAESTTIQTLIAQGNADGYLTVLDLADNATTLNSTEAALLIQAGLEFAADDLVTVQQATGTLLTTSLSGLQHLGVDAINVTGTGGEFLIPAGTGTLDYAHLPTITADASVSVGLELADNLLNAPTTATQAAALKTAGIDVLTAADDSLSVGSTQVRAIHIGGLTFDTASTITMEIASANETTAVTNLVDAINGSSYAGDLDILDALDNAIAITDAQASALVGESLVFAADDAVTVNATVGTAVGTHLQTSLHGLQQLGVDMVGIIGATSGVVDIQAGGTVDFGSLPQVNTPSGVLAGLELSDSALSALSGSDMAALVSKGFDVLSAGDTSLSLTSAQVEAIHAAGLQLNPADSVAMEIASANEATVVNDLVTAIGTASGAPGAYRGDIDVLDLVDNSISISDAQASALVGAGLQFAADDTGVAIQATGTHLSTSLTDLQRLGVDFVHTDGSVNTVVLDLGTIAGGSSILPVFDSEDDVKVSVRDTDLDDVASFLSAGGHNTPNIDALSVALRDAFGAELAGSGVGDPVFQINNLGIELDASVNQLVTLGMILEAADGANDSLAALYGLSGQTLATGLTAAGITNIHVDALTQFQVTDGDLNALLNAGLVSANAAADVIVTNTDGTLDVTLAQLANIGADQVQTSGATLQVHAGVSFSNGAELTAALNQLVATFEAQGGGTVQQLFETADTVDLHVAGSLPSFELDAGLATKLQLLGIDDIKDADGHSIKPNP